MERRKQQAPNNIFKIDNLPEFQREVANGLLEQPLATTRLKFDFGDETFAEYFVAMKIFTWLNAGLHFMRHNGVALKRRMVSYVFHIWEFKSRVLRAKQQQNLNLSSLTILWEYHPGQRKQSQPLLIIQHNGTLQVVWHRSRNSRKQQGCCFPTQCQQ